MPRYAVLVLVLVRGALDTSKHSVNPSRRLLPSDSSLTLADAVVPMFDGRSVSFSEDFAMMLLHTRSDIGVVGEVSAGAARTVTEVALPAGYVVAFTGMEARWPNGKALYRVSVVPDQACRPTQAALATRNDNCLAQTAAVAASP